MRVCGCNITRLEHARMCIYIYMRVHYATAYGMLEAWYLGRLVGHVQLARGEALDGGARCASLEIAALLPFHNRADITLELLEGPLREHAIDWL